VDPTTVAGLEDALARTGTLANMMKQLEGEFDLALIDCPAGLGKVTTRSLEISTHVLSPLQAEPLALRSLGQFLALVDRIRAEKNPNLVMLGIVLSMFDRRTPASLEVAETLWTKFPDGLVFESVIPRDDIFLEASLRGSPLLLMQKRPPPLARLFDQLATDVLDRLDAHKGNKEEDDGPLPLLV